MSKGIQDKSTTRTYGGLSESERQEERRERFLEAGLEIFGTVGLRGATVRSLCKAAGLTERYFYQSFADSDALFCAVYERQMINLQQHFLSRVADFPAELNDRITTALDVFFTLMRNDRIVRVLYIEGWAGSPQVNGMFLSNRNQHAQLTAQFIRLDNPGVTIADEGLVQIAHAINGAFSTMIVQWMLDDYRTPQDTLVASCALIVRGIMRELLDARATG
ncbi:MAG: TetR/AcrR family transcriptional regulator [Gammaproteobacteria bacterium]